MPVVVMLVIVVPVSMRVTVVMDMKMLTRSIQYIFM